MSPASMNSSTESCGMLRSRSARTARSRSFGASFRARSTSSSAVGMDFDAAACCSSAMLMRFLRLSKVCAGSVCGSRRRARKGNARAPPYRQSLRRERNFAVVSGRYRETIMRRLAVCARAIAAATLLIAAGVNVAAAQTVEQFYKGRNLTMLVFSGAGSTYDIYARVLARHFADHIPGKPVVIVQNMLGAGGLKVEQYIYRIAPKDGTVIGTIGRGLPFEPILGENEVHIDPLKFTWLGSMNRDVALAMSWHTSKIKTFADLQQHQLLVPGTGAGADSEILPLAFNRLAGTKFKIIEGYRDTAVAALAM